MAEQAKPLSILHLEDNPADASLIKLMVTAEIPGCTVEHVETPEAYCSALQRGGYDIILSDYRMPHYDGDQALKFARDNFPDLPFIMVTGELGEDRAIETLKRGATDYVLKDNVKRLVPSIRRALEEADVVRQRGQAETKLQETFQKLASAYEELRVQARELGARNEQLEIARQRYQDLFEFTPDAYLITLPDGHIEEANRAAEKLFGMDDSTLKQMRITEFATDKASAREMLLALSTSSQRLELLAILLNRGDQNKDFYADVAIEPSLAHGNGKPALRWMIRDVTERKHNEAALRESEARFRSYFQLGLIGVVITSPAKGLLDLNDEFCRMLGYERAELLEKTWVELTHPDDLSADVAQFNRVMDGEIDAYSLEKRWIHKDDRVIDSRISVRCLRLADGSVEYLVAMVQDITDQKRANEELARFNRSAVDRELRMIELKQEVNDLCMRNGKPPRYPLEFMKDESRSL